MKRTLTMLALALVLAFGAMPAGAATPTAEPAPLYRTAGEAVDGSYVVVLEAGGKPGAVARHAGVTATEVYTEVLDGFAAELGEAQLEAVRRHPDVAYVEEDAVYEADHHNLQFNPPSWGLDRIDQRFLPLDGLYAWHANAMKGNAYVFDTGLDYGHSEFGGRAHFAYDVFGGTGDDCHGHGTHVGGTIGGRTYGVSKQVRLWSVRVLDCNGGGTLTGIIAATDWLAANHNPPAVANYSLGGPASNALNGSVDNLASSGVFVAVAAGNSAADACTVSPAGASEAYTVAASDSSDNHAAFSNHGPCVDIYAPGVNITSLWPGGGTATLSGTSMAAPHVTGVAAQYKAWFGDTASDHLADWLTKVATAGELSGVPAQTPNRLLYKPWEL